MGPLKLVTSAEVGDWLPVRPQLPQWQSEHLDDMHAKRRQVNIHNEPSHVNRLVRLLEELLERDDVRMDADNQWYWKQLIRIKKEIADAAHTGGEGEAEANTTSASEEKGTTTAAD